jgi:hypothetical protein
MNMKSIVIFLKNKDIFVSCVEISVVGRESLAID